MFFLSNVFHAATQVPRINGKLLTTTFLLDVVLMKPPNLGFKFMSLSGIESLRKL